MASVAEGLLQVSYCFGSCILAAAQRCVARLCHMTVHVGCTTTTTHAQVFCTHTVVDNALCVT